MKVNFEKFDSIDNFLKIIESRPNNEIMRNCNQSYTTSKDFSGTANYEEAMNLLQNGYEKPLNQIKNEISKDLKISQTRPRRIPKNHVFGFVPNVPNYILGIPEQMITISQTPQKVKTVSIIYYVGNNYNTTAKALEKAGIKILNAVNRLELSGVRVNLDICVMCSKKNGEWQIGCVNVKGYREQMDLKKLCFPIAHPSMFRRFGFKFLEKSKDMENNFSCGYGSSAKANDEQELNKKVFGETNFFITQDHVQKITVEEIIDLINKSLKNKLSLVTKSY